MVCRRIRSAIVAGVLAAGGALAGPAFAQAQGVTQSAPTATAEERAATERALLADPRIAGIVGPGQPRVVIGGAEINKQEAEAFLEGGRSTPPSRDIYAMVINPRTNQAARIVYSVAENRVLAVERAMPSSIPLTHDDVEQALGLAKANPEFRQAVGVTLDEFKVLDPGSENTVPYAVQALPLRSSNRSDPCAIDRCLDLIFRTPKGYLPLRVHVDLTRRNAVLLRGGRHP
jgi:hypothetical protein